MPEPSAHIGAWKNEHPLANMTPDSLEIRDGCTTILQRISDSEFSGGTAGKNCASKLRGAAYATSEASITRDKIVSWDRGYDAQDKQVWGAVAGGYIFRKIKSY